MGVVAPSEADLLAIEVDEAMVGDGGLVGVSPEVGEDVGGAGERRLGVDAAQGRRVDEAMAQSGGKSGRARGGLGKRAADSGWTVPHALPADLAGALRHLDDAQLDRLRDAVAAETRRRDRPDGKTSQRGAGRAGGRLR